MGQSIDQGIIEGAMDQTAVDEEMDQRASHGSGTAISL
jgi:hypothetical protein